VRRDQTVAVAARRLRAALAPGGAPQERVLGLPWFAAGIGARALVERVLAAADPFAACREDLAL
jgi:hypothetical protein